MNEPTPLDWRRLARATWISIVAHGLAGLLMVFVLRTGLASNDDLADRMRFLDEQRVVWRASWLVWHGAAFSFLWFVVCFARTRPARAVEGRLAIALTAGGVALDLAAQALQMGVLPDLAARGAEAQFLLWDRASVLLTGYVANGMYTLAALVLVATTWRAYAAWVRAAGLALAVGGVWLAAAALADSTIGMIASNALLIPGILVWLYGVGRDATAHAAEER